MVAVYSALGLFNVSNAQPHEDAEGHGPRVAREPHGALQCADDRRAAAMPGPDDAAAELEGESACPHWNEELLADAEKPKIESGTFVRILVKDATQPLEFCNHDRAVHRPSSRWQRKHSLCTLDNFVESQRYARVSGNVDFEKCYN